MIFGAAGGGAAAAAAAESRRLGEEMIVEQSQSAVRLQVGSEILSHIQGNLPAVPTSGKEALDRARLLDSPEILLQDPMNSAIVAVIEHITNNKHLEFMQWRANREREKANPGALVRFLDSVLPSVDDHNEGHGPRSTSCARIKEVLKFFPALEHDSIVARLQILENAKLIHYFYSYSHDDHPRYSPRVWIQESADESHGFKISSKLREFRSATGSSSTVSQ